VLTPAEQWRYADERRQDPDGCDHGHHVFHCTLDGVLKRTSDDEIAVNADRAEVQDGSRAKQHVQ